MPYHTANHCGAHVASNLNVVIEEGGNTGPAERYTVAVVVAHNGATLKTGVRPPTQRDGIAPMVFDQGIGEEQSTIYPPNHAMVKVVSRPRRGGGHHLASDLRFGSAAHPLSREGEDALATPCHRG